MVGADYPFLDVLWTMLIIFAWIIWFWLLITVFTDLFRRHDTSGFAKVLWIIFVIILPFLGVFIYLIVNHDGMTERSMKQAQAQQAQMDDYVRSVAGSGGATAEKVTEAFKIMLSKPKVKGILVNIFCGIMRCDTIANGIVAAARETGIKVPLVVRMKGTNEELGRKILADSGLPIISADNMADAAQKIVAAVNGSRP